MYPVLFSFGPVTFYTFGLFSVLAFLFASFIVWKRGREAHLADEEIFDGIILVTLAGLVGARLTYILFWFDRFGFSPLTWLALVRIPGMYLSGGIASGALALYLLSKRRRWSMLTVSDVAVTGLSFGQSIGWLGAFFSGFGMGKVSRTLGLMFPGETEPRLPAQFLWSIGFFLLFLLLWKLENRYRTFEWYKGRRAEARTGFLTFTYIAVYGLLSLLNVLVGEFTVYWFGIWGVLIAGTSLFLVGIGGLYLNSGRLLTQDWKGLGEGSIAAIRSLAFSARQRLRRIRRDDK